MAEIRG